MNSATPGQKSDSDASADLGSHEFGVSAEASARSDTSPKAEQEASDSAQNGQLESTGGNAKLKPPSSDSSSATADSMDTSEGVFQGPAQAPTEVGVSTLGLSERDAAFFSACYNADVKAIEKAMDEGQDVSVRDVNRRTALHFCAGNGLPTLCKRLLDMGAEINAQDVLGYTPLHMAAGYRKLDTVQVLVEAGADANIGSNDDELAVEIAEKRFERTPKKRFFVANPEYKKMKEIVRVLDDATEVEDDDEEEEEETGKDEVGEIREETDKAKFVVRVKSKGESTTPPPAPPASDVKVTVRVKEPNK